ncbi:MAG: TonB-dependent receptor family protein [Puniceicoccaceae bacterium]
MVGLTFGLILSSSGLATGQADQPEYLSQLDGYTVTATRYDQPIEVIPAAVSLVSRDQVQRARQQLSLDEALQMVPGVFVLNPYNFAQDSRIAIRGFGAGADFGIRGIKLFVDGIPATTPDGQGEVDGMDLGSVERIEILRGPSSAIYGSAAGGVIKIETETGPPIPFVETRLMVGDYDLWQLQSKLGGRRDSLGYLVSTRRTTFGGYRENSRVENSTLNAKFDWYPESNSRYSLIVNWIDFPRQDDAGGLTRGDAVAQPRQAQPRNLFFRSGEEVEQLKVGIAHERILDGGGGLEARGYWLQRDFQNRLPFTSGGQVFLDRKVQGGGLLYRREVTGGRWRAGMDLDWQDDLREQRDNLAGVTGGRALRQEEKVDNPGFFVDRTIEVGEQVILTGALRYDRVRFRVNDLFLEDGDDSGVLSFTAWSPMVGALWQVRDGLSFYLNVAKGFETPTTTELENPRGGGFNPELTAQEAINYETGMRGRVSLDAGWVELDLALFLIEIEDALVPFQLADFPGRDFYRNAASSRRAGIEFSLRRDWENGWKLGYTQTVSDFTYRNFEVGGVDFAGRRLPGIPQYHGAIALSYEPETGLFLNWQTRLIGEFFADDGNKEKISAYQVSDLRFGYQWKSGRWEWEPFGGIYNLFGEDYFANVRTNAFGGRYFEPAPPRNFFGGLKVTYHFD